MSNKDDGPDIFALMRNVAPPARPRGEAGFESYTTTMKMADIKAFMKCFEGSKIAEAWLTKGRG